MPYKDCRFIVESAAMMNRPKPKPDKALKFAMAEIARLKARIARLEAELASRPPGPATPVTIDLGTSTPMLPEDKRRHRVGPGERKWLREQEMRAAIKAVEHAIEWQRSPAWHELLFNERLKALGEAKAAARAEVRAELRKRWAEEDAAELVALPPHISRLME